MHSYPPLNVTVRTPRLELRGASDDLLERLVPAVRDGIVSDGDSPFDDPMSLYDESPDREWKWLRAIWAGRGRVTPAFWRLYLVVMVDDEPVGMQDLIGDDFAQFGIVTTFSWLRPDRRAHGVGTEMRAAALHLAFDGLAAREAMSEAFTDNEASNRVSQRLRYEPNGTGWAMRRGQAALLRRWRLTYDMWNGDRRSDIQTSGVPECRAALGI